MLWSRQSFVRSVRKLSYTLNENRLIRLEERANRNPTNASLQNNYLRELVRQGYENFAKKRHESRKFASSSSVFQNEVIRQQQQQQQTVNTFQTHPQFEQTIPFSNSPLAPIYIQKLEPDFQTQLKNLLTFSLGLLIGVSLFKALIDFMGDSSTSDGQSAKPASGLFGGGSKNYEVQPEAQSDPKMFKDVKGMQEVKEELQEVVSYLKDPKKFTRLGGKLPKGILLTGNPGVGKTLLAKAVAGEAGVPFFYASGSEFEEMFVGVGSRRIRELFQAARKRAPCVIFIDEIDAVGGHRKNSRESYSRMTLNQLLAELDGFSTGQSGVIVLAATNIPESLDPALTRPGRFDRIVTVNTPDAKGRLEILNYYLEKVPKGDDVDVNLIVKTTIGMTGADLSNLVNIACIGAASAGLQKVTMEYFEKALDRVLMGNERLSQIVPENIRKTTAFHEGGHAMVSLLTDGALGVHKATILPRGPSLGRVQPLLEEQDTMQRTKKQMLAELDVLLAGRVAEEIVFGSENITSGASSDLSKATNLAFSMVSQYGMLPNSPTGLTVLTRESSQEMSHLVEIEVKNLLDSSYQRVKTLITKHRKELDLIANTLLEKETLTGEELKKLLCS